MHLLLTYLKPHRALAFVALLLAGASQVLALVDPIIFGRIIDEYAINRAGKTEHELVTGVLGLLGLAVGIAILSRLARALQEYTTRLVVQKLGTHLFNDGLRQVLRLRFQEFEDLRSGEVLSLLQKVRADSERFINTFINTVFAAVVGVGFLTWYSVTKNWLLVPVFLVGVLVLGGLTGLLSREIKTQQRSIVRETNRNSGFITESLRNVELIKSLGLTYPEIRRLQAQTTAIFALEMEKVKRIRLLSFLQGMTLSVLRLSILFALLWLIFREVLSPGELIAMQFISVAIFAPLQELGNIILAYREVEASLLNFGALMKKPVERRPPGAADVGPVRDVRFEQVSFRHKGAPDYALEHVSFDARLGDTIAFVGPSGSGKSTLVKLLVGLYPPASGTVSYNGQPTTALRFNRVRRQIGFVTQEAHMFAGTIRENLLLVKPDATDAEMVAAMEQASCAYLLAKSPDGLDTAIGEMGMKLSGGEKQRLSIARALIRQPRLLIFDEATSALDSLTEEQINETVRRICARRTQITILIAHRLSTVMQADTIFVLEKGRIVEHGSHARLLEGKGLYYAMWRQQIGERPAAPISEDPPADDPEDAYDPRPSGP
ncbi:ABC transporter ATP-binding protein [Pigmentiphaga sp.]|uniref:ABC transporter ATP-binding protein n=1 Tax=Pigmentiphaga sp. TaxID=1977564 RepID=UPI00128E1EB3|nr:ABC transporter ATP-binding protein [Pigmentiphaga sp.]MPS27941.1 ABC transporter ATP-binding protein [Alcaligenaceae bacterium SAGV5]MPS51093.1 ABC transporter ATP-binding protein [Alcaligenaceae bacterium SAGV3]MPT59431.1 ABC transporter ATP-binding protein [Alcaligenaceae bacterium]